MSSKHTQFKVLIDTDIDSVRAFLKTELTAEEFSAISLHRDAEDEQLLSQKRGIDINIVLDAVELTVMAIATNASYDLTKSVVKRLYDKFGKDKVQKIESEVENEKDNKDEKNGKSEIKEID